MNLRVFELGIVGCTSSNAASEERLADEEIKTLAELGGDYIQEDRRDRAWQKQ